MLDIDEKPKRKQAPRRYKWWQVVGLFLVVTLILIGSLLGCLAFGVCGRCSDSDCEQWNPLATQIAATNDAVRTLISQTQIASTPKP